MQYLKKLLDFYIQSSVHIGLALFSLVYVTAFENEVCKHITYPCCVLFGSILGYNFLKYFDIFRKGKFHSVKYYGILVVCLLSVFGFHFFFKRMIDAIKIQLLLGGLMVLLYPPMRKHGIVKMFWVSFVVAYLTAFVFIWRLPTFKGIVVLEFVKRFFIICALMIPFEIYDSQHDEKTLNTLPQKFGINKAKLLGYSFLILYVLLGFLSCPFKQNYFLIDTFIATVTAASIHFSTLERSKYYTSFWVESIPILWWVLVLVLQ